MKIDKKGLTIILFTLTLILTVISNVSAEDNVGTFTDLQNLINNDNTGEITLTQDYSYNSYNDYKLQTGVKINKNLTINGQNHTINGRNQATIFNVNNSINKEKNMINVEFNNINFINSYSTSNGAAITSHYGDLSVYNSNFISNHANKLGGSIYTYYGNVNINNSYFFNNYASGGGSVCVHYSNLYINNTKIIKSTANIGGSITCTETVTIDNTDIINGTAYTESGILWGATDIYIYNSKFINNLGNTEKDNFWTSYPLISTYNATIFNSTFENNTVYNGEVLRSTNHTYIIYSSFVNNKDPMSNFGDIRLGYGMKTVNYNWWGNNTPFNGNNYGNRISLIYGRFTYPENYVIMSLNVSKKNISTNDISKVTVSLDKYKTTDSNTIFYLNDVMPSRFVNFNVNSGNLSPTSGELIDNFLEANFSAQDEGIYPIYSQIDNQILSDIITVYNAPVEISTIIDVDNFTKIYGTDDKFVGNFLDSEGNAIIGHPLSITLSRKNTGQTKTYTIVSDYKGEFSIPINLGIGSYSAEVNYEGVIFNNKTYLPSGPVYANIEVVKEIDNRTTTFLTANMFNEPYGAGESFTGNLKDSDGNNIIGHHLNVKLTRLSSGASKTYDCVVDYTGTFYLTINLAPGKYMGECSYSGTTKYKPSVASNTITVY